jgi:hypothetical protein
MNNLSKIQSEAIIEAQMYTSMPQNGKKKYMDDLEYTIQTLQKIRENLEDTGDQSLDVKKKNLVQIVFGKCNANKNNALPTFTKQDVITSFQEHFASTLTTTTTSFLGHVAFNTAASSSVPIVIITSIEFQDNYTLDPKTKQLQPLRMCFIKFFTEEDASFALGLTDMILNVKQGESSSSYPIQFIQPAQTSATHKTFRHIGNLLNRLREIHDEFNNIGAERRMGGIPKLKPEFLDKALYLTSLSAYKFALAAGSSLDTNAYGILISRTPVDTEALQLILKPLYDEECDILIQLREHQINGVDFDFDH